VANKPVLEYAVESMSAVGIEEIGIILGNKGRDQIRSTLGSGDRFGVDITYIVQGDPNGLADAVSHAEAFVDQNPFMVYFGDTILSEQILSSLSSGFTPSRHDVGIVFQKVDNPGRYGIGRFEGDKLTGVDEKPDDPPSDLAYVGAVVMSPTAFDIIADQEPSDRGELELTDTIDQLVRGENPAYWDVVPGLWKDVGTPEDVIQTNKILLDNYREWRRSELSDSARDGIDVDDDCSIAADATLIGPVSIAEGVSIEGDSVIGPHVSIAADCQITDARIESSVILNGTRISYVSLSRSLVGSGATITGGVDADIGDLSATVSRNADISLK
jgi:glucose-1-phosphate thymidylyltransferase